MKNKGIQHKGELMFGHIRDWEASGLAQIDYCIRQGIPYHRFQYWLRKHRQAVVGRQSAPPCFVPIEVGPPEADGAIVVRYPGGTEVHLPAHAPAEYIRQLVATATIAH